MYYESWKYNNKKKISKLISKLFKELYISLNMGLVSRYHGTPEINVRKKTKIRNRYNQVPHLTPDTVWESDKTQENITCRRAKRSTLSQQVTIRLQGTDKTIWQRQTQNIKDPQKQYRLGTVSRKNYWGLKLVSRYQLHP